MHQLKLKDNDIDGVMLRTMDRLKTVPIKCFKYSNKLGADIINPGQYTNTINISEDAKRIIIMNRKYAFSSKYKFDSNIAEKQGMNNIKEHHLHLKEYNKICTKMSSKKKMKLKTLKGFIDAINGEIEDDSNGINSHDFITDDEDDDKT